MVVRSERGLKAAVDTNEDEEDFVGHAINGTTLYSQDSSAYSLDGRSLIVPDYGDVDDMSSLGTSKYNYRGDDTVGYIGDMKIVGRADDYNTDPLPVVSTENKSSSHHDNDPAIQYGNYDLRTDDSLLTTEENDDNPSQLYEEKIGDEKKTTEVGCIPRWITEAPLWLKLIIISSIALLLGALVLIAVGAKLSTEEQVSPSPQQSNPTRNPIDLQTQTNEMGDPLSESGLSDVTTNLEESVTTATVNPVISPSLPAETETTNSSWSSPMEMVSNLETETPLSNDPIVVSRTVFPTQSPTLSTINFFVIGGRFDGEDTKILENGLKSLPSIDENTVIFHLGDWNSPYSTSCVEDSFIAHVDNYQQSSIPVYFVPGDNEYNDCPNPSQALGYWNQYLLDFETKYWEDPSWDIIRQGPDYSENFAFLQREILFVGINLVGGIVHDQEEWDARHEADLLWIDTNTAKYDGNFTTVVILAHADPDIEINQNFFNRFYAMVEQYDEQVIFIHRNLGIDTWKREVEFMGIPNLDVVAVEGSKWPPMWVQIDPLSGTYTIDQSLWYNEYVTTGTIPPASSP